MDTRKKLLALGLVLLLLIGAAFAAAEQTISTTLVMRVSRMTQSAVVDAGEDLSMEVSIDGAEPASYQWYFNDVKIDGANQKVYNIVDAQPEDAGIYRLDAFDADGKLVVSMDITARVIVPEVPKSGDTTIPAPVVLGMMALAAGVLVMMRRRTA